MSTWFKYYRSSTDHHLRSKPLIWIYWLYCLEQAAWKDHTVFWKGEEYTLQTGHFITTIERDKDKNGLSQSQIRNARTVLAKCNMIDIQSSRQGTLVKVNNWNDFQERNGEQPQTIQHKTDTLPTQKRHTTDTKTATTVEGIERKKVRRKRITTDAPEYSEPFEKFWKIYPKAEDKAEAFELYQELQPDHEKDLLEFAFSYGAEFSRARKQYAKKAKYILRNMEWKTWMQDQQQTKRESDPAPVRDIKPPATGVRSYGAYALRVRDQCKGIDTSIIKAAFEEGIDVNQLIQNHQQEAV